MGKKIRYILLIPVRIVKWFFHDKPWKWRPFFDAYGGYAWTFGGHFAIEWTPDGLKDFDYLDFVFFFGPWTVAFGLRDND